MGAACEDGVSVMFALFLVLIGWAVRYCECRADLELGLGRVYAELRSELWGEAMNKFRQISYVHGRLTSRPARVKL